MIDNFEGEQQAFNAELRRGSRRVFFLKSRTENN